MQITLKCFATLATFLPENSDAYPISEGETVASLVEKIGIPQEEIHLIFVNSLRVGFDTAVKDGDRVGLFPAVGGG